MKALVHTSAFSFEYREVEEPRPDTGELLIRIASVGICGSDVHGMSGKTGRRIPPVIMGHEAAGVIVESGPGGAGSRFEAGDRVTFDSTIYCNRCSYCLEGRVNLCDNRRVLGVSCGEYRRDGAMAEFVTVPEHIIYRLPDRMSFDQAAMIEPVSIGFHAVRRASPRIGDSALVIGCGIIGQFTIQAAKLAGCGFVAAVDLDAGRLEMARKLGADAAVESGSASWKSELRSELERRTGRAGFDHVFEAVGLEITVQSAMDLVKKGGRTILIGNISPEVRVPLQRIVTGELDVLGSCASSG
ncbi:MAG TPA: alcohol dehydrogenase catalytic domain-containing protein, partial [Spirochaetia bacterium]|nr:alcohol dehydrogenase catalytic domain-containing protein [Spirochaetia bacterium]